LIQQTVVIRLADDKFPDGVDKTLKPAQKPAV